MDSTGQAFGMQRLVTGFRCEKNSCTEQAEWFISMGVHSYHWCAKHTVSRMEEKRFWQQKVAPRLVI